MSNSSGIDQESIVEAIKNATPGQRTAEETAKKRAYLVNYDLPVDCPVVPLGIEGDTFFYLDANKQLRPLAASKHGRLDLQSLFVPYTDLLDTYWPAKDKEGEITGWKPEMCARALMDAAGKIGPVSIENKVRGPGCWLGSRGELVMHCGDKIISGDRGVMDPGQIGEHVYPAAPKKPKPAEEECDASGVEELLSLLKTWNWRRGHLDPHLVLGWIAAAIMGGALQWRPLVWISGDKATGKSTLHDVINKILGEDGMISTADTTAAGIRQAVGHMTLPVAIDELEAEEDNRRQMDVIKIARFACSGAQALRGGADHKGSRFVLRNCFMFSSILIPPMMSQDVSRMAILQLDTLTDATPPALEPDRLSFIGSVIRRRIMDRWPDFATILHKYRAALTEVGHGGRSADQFGTLMACHDLILEEGIPSDEHVESWAEQLKWSAMNEAESDEPDWQKCINHLMQSQVDYFRNGERFSVGTWVMRAAGMEVGYQDFAEANKVLASVGLRVKEHYYTDKPVKVLLIANSHQGLQAIFRETHWTGKSGAAGVWVQSMRRIPNACAGASATRFDGVLTRYTMMPVDQVLSNEVDKSTKGGYDVSAS